MHFVAFAYQTNFFLDNYKPEDDTPSEMDDDNLNSTLVFKGKKRQKLSLHEGLIILEQEQMEAQREQEERNRMFFRQIMEKQREAEAEEREKDRKFLLELDKFFSGNKEQKRTFCF